MFSADNPNYKPFVLTDKFVAEYKDKEPPFGFGGLGEFVFRRTYSRPTNGNPEEIEEWHQCVERVVNGTYNMQKRWIDGHKLGWVHQKAHVSAKDMYSRIFDMKFLPPGRGLWAMGSPLTEERRLYAPLNNCAFVSTSGLKNPGVLPSSPFRFLMDASMLGVGVGFDTKAVDDRIVIKGLDEKKSPECYEIPDTREGWVEALGKVIDAHFNHGAKQTFTYHLIRKKGAPIRGFGGVSSGPEILQELLEKVDSILSNLAGKEITTTCIVDIMNLIGTCVVAGNVRRTAEIAFGSHDDEEYMNLKNYEKNPHRAAYGWTSNNSVFADLGMDYKQVCDRIRDNGEPGFAWLKNMQSYSRMVDPPDNRDHRARGGNPCLEQTLEPYELCCLVEVFPDRHENFDDFARTLKYAYLYAKTVTLGPTPWQETNRVTLRNRRIGCSLSGIAQFIANRGIGELKDWCEGGYKIIKDYDAKFSDWFAIPRSIKVTSVKPSGTVSLLAGATAGLHYPTSRFVRRRVRVGADSPLLIPLREAGYPIEKSVYDSRTAVVTFPVDHGEGVRSEEEVSMWEQLSLAAFMQKYWADNQVSATITFDPKTEGHQLEHALDFFQYQLKGVSFLPRNNGAYQQMPLEKISEEEYKDLVSSIKPVNFRNVTRLQQDFIPDRGCDGGSCELPENGHHLSQMRENLKSDEDSESMSSDSESLLDVTQ